MGVINRLASALNRRDQIPNQELAREIVARQDKDAIEELVDHLHSKNAAISNDCIKVLYEIGELDARLIANYADTFIQLLDDKNNRMQWGAMTALSAIASANPKPVHKALPKIIATASQGTVITRDHAVNILISLCAIEPFSDKAFSLLLTQIENSRPNQVAMYVEKAMPVIQKKHGAAIIQMLTNRLPDFDKESKRKRVEKLIHKLNKM